MKFLVMVGALGFGVVACANEGVEDPRRIKELEAQVEDRRRVKELEAQVESLKSAPAVPSVPTESPVVRCSTARVAAHDVWQKAEQHATKEANAAQGRWTSFLDRRDPEDLARCVTNPDEQECVKWRTTSLKFEEMLRDAREKEARIKAATKATTEGALKLRDAARAPTDDPDNPTIAEAKKLSLAAFDACKDIQP